MNTKEPKNQENQEIDLGRVFKGVSNAFESSVYGIFQFIKNNIIAFLILLVLGIGLGYYLDRNSDVYEHKIIVMPNFDSNEYLYAKVEQLSSKVKKRDTTFFQNLGFPTIEYIRNFLIEPIIDVYQFVSDQNENFDLIKLMAEDNHINAVIEDRITSKNYDYHLISLYTSKEIQEGQGVLQLIGFLNDSDYFRSIQAEEINNTQVRLNQNEETIAQINKLWNEIVGTDRALQGFSDRLVYYNENKQLNDVLITKQSLVEDQALLRLKMVNQSHIIKPISTTLNIKIETPLFYKMKFILPVFFIVIFIISSCLFRLYKRQSSKQQIK